MSKLDDKLRKVETEHAEGVVAESLAQHDQARRDAANRYLGGVQVIGKLKEHLASQEILAYMTVEEGNLYLEFDCQTFAEFLDSEHSTMSSSKYYRLRDFFLSEGHTKFDLLTDWGIPARIRKQLEAGDIEIDGDEVVIGGTERVAIGESPKLIKAIIERLVTEKNSLNDDLAKAEEKSEKLTGQVKKGTEEYNELQRAVDAINEQTPYERAFLGCVKAMMALATTIEHELPDEDERLERGAADCKTLAGQFFQIRDAYGVSVPLAERAAASDDPLMAKVDAELAKQDWSDDEEEPA